MGTKGTLHKKRDIQFRRDHHVKGLDAGIFKCREIGNESLARQYEHLRNWYQKLSYQLLLKSWMLGEMIGYSFNNHVIATILTDTDQSLGTIEIKIDQDFVRSKEHIIFWKDLNRSHFYSYTYRNPTPVIEEWPEDHPFFMAKNKKNGSHVVDHSVMRNAINFNRSHDTSLLQVADLVAGIISKYYNRDEFDDVYSSISRYFMPPAEPIRLLKMATQEQAKRDTTPNPWEQLSGK